MYQRLPPVDSLSSSSSSGSSFYYPPNNGASHGTNGGVHHPNAHAGYLPPPAIDRPSHPLPPGAFMQHPNGQLGAGDGSEYSNGLTEYYPESYVQPCSSPAAFNSHPSPVFPQQAGPSTSAEPTATSPRIVNFASNSPSLPPSSLVKQQLQQHIHQQRPKLHNMYGHSPAVSSQQQQQPMGQHSISATHSPSAHSPATPSFHPHPAIPPPSTIVDTNLQTSSGHSSVHSTASMAPPREHPILYVPRSSLLPQSHVVVSSNGTHHQSMASAHSTDGMPANSTAKMPAVSTSTPSTAAASISSTTTSGDSAEKPKPPKPKRVRKTAAQLKAERAEKAAAEAARLAAASQPPPNASSAPKDIVITRPLAPNTSGDSSHLLMPPPKVAQAPSVLAAAAKAANSSAVHPQQQPASTSQTAAIPPSPYPPLTPTTSEANEAAIMPPPVGRPPKRPRAPSQRALQQQARLLKQQEAERAKAMEDRRYAVKCLYLRKTVRALVFKNGALSDEVARLKMQIDVCKEETKIVAKRVQHHERNKIRRAQTQERKALARANAAAAATAEAAAPSVPIASTSSAA